MWCSWSLALQYNSEIGSVKVTHTRDCCKGQLVSSSLFLTLPSLFGQWTLSFLWDFWVRSVPNEEKESSNPSFVPKGFLSRNNHNPLFHLGQKKKDTRTFKISWSIRTHLYWIQLSPGLLNFRLFLTEGLEPGNCWYLSSRWTSKLVNVIKIEPMYHFSTATHKSQRGIFV